MNLPTLYKLTSANKVQQWTISVVDNVIHTEYGQVDGARQTTSDTVDVGKNVGKKNETTPAQQALLEALAKHEKQLKRGYVLTPELARAGAVDEVVEGGVLPMLAKVFEDHGHKLSYPVAVQPKLDGHRCVAVVDIRDGAETGAVNLSFDVSLWTRTRKRILSMPHIVEQIRDALTAASKTTLCLGEGRLILDGELYCHAYRDRFEDLTSLIRPDEPRPGHEVVEYHVYDIVSPETFLKRFRECEHVFDTTTSVKLVETHVAADEAALLSHYDAFRAAGYEGAMARRLDRGYEHKRSDQLLKMKDFVDGEFRVVRLEEGRGKLQGHVGAFVCITPDGKEFGAKGAMPNETLRQAWAEPEKWVGKTMIVKYFGVTAEGSLRFPSALRLRDDL